MATARFEGSDLTLLAVYFGASLVWFFCVALYSRYNGAQTTAGAVVLGLGAVMMRHERRRPRLAIVP